MRARVRTWASVTLTVIALHATAAAGGLVDAVIQPGDKFLGKIDAPGDVDVVVFGAVAGTYVRFVVKPTAGSPMRPLVMLVDKTTGMTLVRKEGLKPRPVVVRGMRLPSTGLYEIRVQGAGASLGSYCVSTKGRMPRPALTQVANETVAAGESLTLTFEAGPGFTLRGVVVEAAGSPADMIDVQLMGPTAPVVLKVAERSRKLLMKSDGLPQLGSYVLTLYNRGGTGVVTGRLRLAQPKHKAVTYEESDDD